MLYYLLSSVITHDSNVIASFDGPAPWPLGDGRKKIASLLTGTTKAKPHDIGLNSNVYDSIGVTFTAVFCRLTIQQARLPSAKSPTQIHSSREAGKLSCFVSVASNG